MIHVIKKCNHLTAHKKNPSDNMLEDRDLLYSTLAKIKPFINAG